MATKLEWGGEGVKAFFAASLSILNYTQITSIWAEIRVAGPGQLQLDPTLEKNGSGSDLKEKAESGSNLKRFTLNFLPL